MSSAGIEFWADPANIVRLRALWAEGVPTMEIGRRMGVSKNAIVGKAHRLGLPGRPSPIKKGAAPGSRRHQPRAPKITIAGIVSAEVAAATNTNAMLPLAVIEARAVREMVAEPDAKPIFPAPRGKIGECLYPVTGGRGVQYRSCGDATEPGKPYCHTHANLCYARSAAQRAGVLTAVRQCAGRVVVRAD